MDIKSQNSPTVAVIGLDGGTWRLLDRILERSAMPNLQKFLSKGVKGELQSCYPPITAPAWSSFMTGTTPGKHGVFDFIRFDRSSKETQLVNSTSINIPTLWEILTKNGKKVGTIHVPLTFPPTKVDGFMVSGIPLPTTDYPVTYPDFLADELAEKIGRYNCFISPKAYNLKSIRGIRKFINDLNFSNSKICEASLYLLDKFELDFFMIHFQMLDILQHGLGDMIFSDDFFSDSACGHIIPGARELVLDFFSCLDCCIGRILDRFTEDTTVMFMSDHGFARVDRQIMINNYLVELGLLKVKTEGCFSGIKDILPRPRFAKNLYKSIASHFYKSNKLRLDSNIAAMIDWDLSKYCAVHGTIYGLIYDLCNNTNKSQSQEDIDMLIKNISQLTDPVTGKCAIKKVYKTSEIYPGPGLMFGPDLIIIPNDGYQISTPVSTRKVFLDWQYATHRIDGLIAAKGPAIKGQGEVVSNIMCMAPTILYLFGIAIPQYMDGEVIEGLLASEYLDKNRIIYDNAEAEKRSSSYSFSSDENEKIKNKLSDLGYL